MRSRNIRINQNATFTAWILPKEFIDVTSEPDVYEDAMEEMEGATIQ